jgi:hypothetical protein
MTCLRMLGIVCLLGATAVAGAQEPARSEGWVVISVDEYRALRIRAFPPDPGKAPPPVDATITRVHYDLSATGTSATGTVALTVDVLKDGWVNVVIPPGLLVRSATLDGRPVTLLTDAHPEVLLSKPGRSVLTLQIVVPVTTNGATASLEIPPAPAPLVDAVLRVPRAGVDLMVQNGFVASEDKRPDESRWTIHSRGGQPMHLSWRQRADDERAKLPLRLRGSVTEFVGLGEDATQVSATIQAEASQGATSDLTIALPPGLTVTQVSGPLVADWDTGTAGLLRVSLLEPLTATTSIAVTGERRGGASGETMVPLLRLPDAERETGGVAVEVLGAGEITGKQPLALEPADPLDLGSIVSGRASPSLVAFRYKAIAGRADRALSVSVARYAAQAVLVANVDEARYQVLLTEDGKSLVRARYAVRNNQRSLLSVTLPEGATVWNAAVAGRPVRPGQASGGALLLPLEKGRSQDDLPPFGVEVVYVARAAAWNGKGNLDLPLPALDLPISRTGVEVHYSPRFRLTIAPGSFREDTYTEPFSPALRAEALPPPPPPPPPPASDIQLRIESKPAGVGGVGEGAGIGRGLSGEVAGGMMKDGSSRATDSVEGLRALMAKEGARHYVAGVLPVDVPFPEFGPRLYLASELTSEGQRPLVQLSYQRDNDHPMAASLGGVR